MSTNYIDKLKGYKEEILSLERTLQGSFSLSKEEIFVIRNKYESLETALKKLESNFIKTYKKNYKNRLSLLDRINLRGSFYQDFFSNELLKLNDKFLFFKVRLPKIIVLASIVLTLILSILTVIFDSYILLLSALVFPIVLAVLSFNGADIIANILKRKFDNAFSKIDIEKMFDDKVKELLILVKNDKTLCENLSYNDQIEDAIYDFNFEETYELKSKVLSKKIK